jgi:hypothetical protein
MDGGLSAAFDANDPNRTIRAQICCAAQLTFYCARLRSSTQGGLGETAITSAVDCLCHPHTNGRMAMKTFLLFILATAFTVIVSVAAAGPCGDSSNCDVERPETSIMQSCITLDCRCGGC